MPILDPILQYNLLAISCKPENCNINAQPNSFYLKYLKIARNNINHNTQTILASIRFKKDLKSFISIIPKHFEQKTNDFFNENNIKKIYSQFTNIYYTILFNIKCEKNDCIFEGKYFQYCFLGSDFNFFKLEIDKLNFRSWFLSDSPIAILCLHLNKINIDDFKLLLFEIDLLFAANLTLVLCISDFQKCILPDFNQIINELIKIIADHPFSEIHVTFDSDQYEENFFKFVQNIIINYDKFNSYFYFYTHYFDPNKYDDSFRFEEINITIPIKNLYTKKTSNRILSFNESLNKQLAEELKSLKKMNRMKLIRFSDSIKDSLIELDSNYQSLITQTENKFNLCFDGFNNKQIKIILVDTPLFNDESKTTCFYSCEFTNTDKYKSCGLISSEDFLYRNEKRVKILVNIKTKRKTKKVSQNQIESITKFINFEDIHNFNQNLYVKSQLSLFRKKSNLKEKCNSIIDKLRNGTIPREFIKIKVNNKLGVELIEELFTSALYYYKVHHNSTNETVFKYNMNQIYTAYEIVESCFIKNCNTSGFVYQIPTGEGKSAIIFIVASILAKMKKTVHIVTSNIYLANRDYNNSHDFFSNLGLISTVLLHQNEKPDFTENSFSKNNYPNEFFGDSIFENSLRMNFEVCNKKAQIIFSTISNFECYYLYMTEKKNDIIAKYYENSILLIDEADSILIDEIANGTIISRPIKSNCSVVLKKIYDRYTYNHLSSVDILTEIKEQHPECADLQKEDVDIMIKEIDIVNSNEKFVNNKKYVIIDGEIVPFDFDNKGIIECNKEFSGFIEQFIAIKEINSRTPNVKINDISLNYLYISHPIYVKLYSNVYGLTGTIGDKCDKKLLYKHYKLKSKNIPKECPNRCYHFLTTICNDIKERNNLIAEEIIEFHKNDYPVLVILYSPDEIEKISNLIKNSTNNKITNIQTYDGKDQKIILNNNAGTRGAITLGTNVCGRGMHIEVYGKHLHVIIGFYSKNKRVLQQAFGRTSRKDKFGSVHIICLKKEINCNCKNIKNEEIKKSLQKYEIFKNKQQEYINAFQTKASWIFNLDFNYTKKLTVNERQNLRYPKINVNRLTICDYKYPFCMNERTFLKIQLQKIFSLYNCPNCKYTWQLFQQYMRELILESWSIFINKAEKKFICESFPIKEIERHLENGKKRLIEELSSFFIEKDGKVDIYDTFYNIFKRVNNDYEYLSKTLFIIKDSQGIALEDDNAEILNFNFFSPQQIRKEAKISKISLEIRPFQLIERSGSRINRIKGGISYIEDPELKYKRVNSDKPFSITEVLDNIFDKICNMVNDLIEEHIMFRLFLRRTMAGCEFGICYDFCRQIQTDDIFCLIDKNAFLIFSININTPIPFLAGVLIFMVFYISNIIKNIIGIFKSLIQNLAKESIKIFKQIIDYIKDDIIDKSTEPIYDKIIEHLENNINEIIEKFKNIKPKMYFLIHMLTNIIVKKVVDKSEDFNESFVEMFFDKINKKFVNISKIREPTEKPIGILFKIGFLCALLLFSHMISFHINFLFEKKLKFNSDAEKISTLLKTNHDDKTIQEVIDKKENNFFSYLLDLNVQNIIVENLNSMINSILIE